METKEDALLAIQQAESFIKNLEYKRLEKVREKLSKFYKHNTSNNFVNVIEVTSEFLITVEGLVPYEDRLINTRFFISPARLETEYTAVVTQEELNIVKEQLIDKINNWLTL
jgi:hypothetical protein